MCGWFWSPLVFHQTYLFSDRQSMLGPKPSSQTQQFHRDIFFLWQMSLSQKIHEMFPHQRLQMKKYIKRIFGKKYDVRKRRKTILQKKKKKFVSICKKWKRKIFCLVDSSVFLVRFNWKKTAVDKERKKLIISRFFSLKEKFFLSKFLSNEKKVL